MPKKPHLSVVKSDATSDKPPRTLGKHGLKLWQDVQAEYGIHDVGGRELLAQACGALDQVEALRAAIEREGATLHTRNGIKVHPATKDLLVARSIVVRTLEKLGIASEAIKSPGRPPQYAGWTGEED